MDWILLSHGWANEEKAWPEHAKELSRTIQNAAKKLACPVIGTDLIGKISHGPWKGLVYGGSSVASDKDGNILGIGKDRDRDVLLVKVEL